MGNLILYGVWRISMLDLSFNPIAWPLNRFDNHLCIKAMESASITVTVEITDTTSTMAATFAFF
jgi:hypothetical protein